MSIIYKSLSTDKAASKDGNLYGIDVLRISLLSLFKIRKGTVVMMPELGSIAWDYIFEPSLTPYDIQQIEADSLELINTYEPRVTVNNIMLGQYGDGFYIVLSVEEKESKETIDLRVEFNE